MYSNINTVNRIARLALSLGLIFIVLSLGGPLGALAYLPFVSIYTGITAFIGWDPAIALMGRWVDGPAVGNSVLHDDELPAH